MEQEKPQTQDVIVETSVNHIQKSYVIYNMNFEMLTACIHVHSFSVRVDFRWKRTWREVIRSRHWISVFFFFFVFNENNTYILWAVSEGEDFLLVACARMLNRQHKENVNIVHCTRQINSAYWQQSLWRRWFLVGYPFLLLFNFALRTNLKNFFLKLPTWNFALLLINIQFKLYGTKLSKNKRINIWTGGKHSFRQYQYEKCWKSVEM